MYEAEESREAGDDRRFHTDDGELFTDQLKGSTPNEGSKPKPKESHTPSRVAESIGLPCRLSTSRKFSKST